MISNTSTCYGLKIVLAGFSVFAAYAAYAQTSSTPTVIASQPPIRVLDDGKRLFDTHCSYCHGAGAGRGGTAALERRLGKNRALLENRDDLNGIYVESVVRNGLNAMIPFRRTEINDRELQLIIDWLGRPRSTVGPTAYKKELGFKS